MPKRSVRGSLSWLRWFMLLHWLWKGSIWLRLWCMYSVCVSMCEGVCTCVCVCEWAYVYGGVHTCVWGCMCTCKLGSMHTRCMHVCVCAIALTYVSTYRSQRLTLQRLPQLLLCLIFGFRVSQWTAGILLSSPPSMSPSQLFSHGWLGSELKWVGLHQTFETPDLQKIPVQRWKLNMNSEQIRLCDKGTLYSAYMKWSYQFSKNPHNWLNG